MMRCAGTTWLLTVRRRDPEPAFSPVTNEPRFFPTPADLAAWFAEHGATETELFLGYRKKGTGRPSVTWPESVDEALSVGWIDGVRRRIDDDSYVIRFTPRKKGSTWSAVNIARDAVWWVISAKQRATRDRRLAKLVADSGAERRLAHLSRP